MKVSIAMTTYNGAKYLREQLESFSAQERLPDELIVCDDMSNDQSIEILLKFARTAPFKVEIVRNESNLGYTRNFEKAIYLCTGSLIFLSDQDDVWSANKLRVVENEFELRPDVFVLVNDAELTDENLKPTGLTLAGQTKATGLSTDQLLNGCCMSFRSELKSLIIPIPNTVYDCDSWINTLGNALQLRRFSPQVLQFYRRHTSNTSNWLVTRTTPASKWKVLREQLRWSFLRGDPEGASATRLEQLSLLKNRLKAHETYLIESLALRLEFDFAVIRIQQDQRANELRLEIQQRFFLGDCFRHLSFTYLAATGNLKVGRVS
jgi:glycosyltransferase involved in cell wall biosynthesis